MRSRLITALIMAIICVSTALGMAKGADGGWKLIGPREIGAEATLRDADHERTPSDAGSGFRAPRVGSVALDYSMPGGLYAEQSTGRIGLVHSADGGKTWRFIHYAYGLVATSARQPKTVVIAGSYTISISRDGGGTWIENRLPESVVTPVFAIDRDRPERIVMGSRGQVLTTNDAGVTWSSSDVPVGGPTWASDGLSRGHSKLDVSAIAISPVDGALLVGTQDNVLRDMPWGNPRSHGVKTLYVPTFRSKDFGQTWEALPALEGGPVKNVSTISFDPRNPKVIYASSARGNTWSTFLKSTDGGLTWLYHEDSPIRNDINSIAIDPVNTRRIYVGTPLDGVFISDDAGESWRKDNEGMQVEPGAFLSVASLTVDPRNHNHVYAATTVGLYERTY